MQGTDLRCLWAPHHFDETRLYACAAGGNYRGSALVSLGEPRGELLHTCFIDIVEPNCDR